MHRWLAEDDHCQRNDDKSYNKENNKLPALEVDDLMNESSRMWLWLCHFYSLPVEYHH